MMKGLCSYQFHPKPSPPRDKPPGHDWKGAKTLPPGQSLYTKTLPPGQNGESKTPPPGHKVRKFHKCVYNLSLTLFEMGRFVVSI